MLIRRFWQMPWGYKESFAVAGGLLVSGMAIEAALGGVGVSAIQSPNNIIIGVALLQACILSHLFLRKNNIVKWLSSVPAAISAIVLITVLVLLMGLTPQNDNLNGIIKNLGLTHLTSSWVFALAQLYFIVVLGFVSIKRTIPFRKKNIGFMLNHWGLWISISAAVLGAGDMRNLKMNLVKNKEFTNYAFSTNNQPFQLGVALKLLEFTLEEYPAKLAIIDTTWELKKEGEKGVFMIRDSLKFHFMDWDFSVDEYLPSAKLVGDRFVAVNDIGTTQSVKVSATNRKTNKKVSGWVTCGSILVEPKALSLTKENMLVMLPPVAKKYQSKVVYLTKDGDSDTIDIEVNKPQKVGTWEIYQQGYNDELGKWSNTSLLGLVSDPWLPIVYIGFYMLMAGAVHIFWIGKNKSGKTQS